MPSSGKPAKTKKGVKGRPWGPERTANWADVPGKTQPRDRSGGTKRVRQSVKQSGL
jgi:hypothetical protein